MVRLPALGARRPGQLSGGQRQRVALARAIVCRPQVLLLDEPLGALDLKLRQEMQVELKRIQSEVGITFLYVTHDQEEALTMSDRLAVFNRGRVEQIGTPAVVYEQPATGFVAGFVGISNVLDRNGVRFVVRPEKIRMLEPGEQTEPGGTIGPGMIEQVHFVTHGPAAPGYYIVANVPGGVYVCTPQMEAVAAQTYEHPSHGGEIILEGGVELTLHMNNQPARIRASRAVIRLSEGSYEVCPGDFTQGFPYPVVCPETRQIHSSTSNWIRPPVGPRQ